MNAHNFHAIRRRIEDAYERAKMEGSDMAEVCESLMKLEAELCRIEMDRLRGACELMKKIGTPAYADRRGMTPSGARKKRQRGLNKIGTLLRV